MIYLGEKHIRAVGLHWQELADCIEDAVHVMDSGDYAQPVKPYLRYGSKAANRIIAMPAYVGGSMHTAGIKWIASFPGNLQIGLPRAHSLRRSALAGFDPAEPVLFCPMGMAVFDIATADYWVQKAR